ncbi:hypothetical protein PROPEN_00875 [Proteus penneri ATCC 35198]|nr:hypothetical protein PROPEN_00875 [Proteus penneri ATCC 35198]
MAKKPQKIGTSFNLPTNKHFFKKTIASLRKLPIMRPRCHGTGR